MPKQMPSESSNPGTSLHWQDDSGIVHRLTLTDKIFLGRTCRGIDPDKRIIIRNPTISRDHAVVSLARGKVEITDLSKNGTWVNDVRMAPGSSQRLADGDHISLGGVSIYLSHPQATAAATDTWSEQTAIQPAAVFVTSLVADVRGFTTFSQQTDSPSPISVHALPTWPWWVTVSTWPFASPPWPTKPFPPRFSCVHRPPPWYPTNFAWWTWAVSRSAAEPVKNSCSAFNWIEIRA